MATITRRIGLSLGADICWAAAFEDILKKLDVAIPSGKDTVKVHCERVTIEPYDLQQKIDYDLVIDRLTHWYPPRREWIKKAVIMDGVYVWNNPWSVQSMEKHTTYCAMMRLGMPVPKTRILPPKEYDPKTDLRVTLERTMRVCSTLPSRGAPSVIRCS
jgi:glutathione synthase/RimK-type ligase-like ATP-grasp enzyme